MLSTHTTLKELSEQLAKAGVKQESIFWHTTFNDKHGWNISTSPTGVESYSAFLATEILEMLPVTIGDSFNHLRIIKYGGHWTVKYNVEDISLPYHNIIFKHKNLAEAAGQMLLWLINHQLVEVKNL